MMIYDDIYAYVCIYKYTVYIYTKSSLPNSVLKTCLTGVLAILLLLGFRDFTE